MKLIHVIIYIVIFWIAAAFSQSSDFAMSLCYGLGMFGIAAVLVNLVRHFINRLKP